MPAPSLRLAATPSSLGAGSTCLLQPGLAASRPADAARSRAPIYCMPAAPPRRRPHSEFPCPCGCSLPDLSLRCGGWGAAWAGGACSTCRTVQTSRSNISAIVMVGSHIVTTFSAPGAAHNAQRVNGHAWLTLAWPGSQRPEASRGKGQGQHSTATTAVASIGNTHCFSMHCRDQIM